jgi:ribosomal protein L40E
VRAKTIGGGGASPAAPSQPAQAWRRLWPPHLQACHRANFQEEAMTVQAQPWTCSKCQASNDADFTACRLCGAPNPLILKPGQGVCAGCGQVHDQTCCPSCGSPEFLQL